MNQYCLLSSQPDSQGKRFTQQRCAVATIKSFKPAFQRIPSGQVGKMTVSETLALHVDQVKIVGSAGEPEFGSPKALENHRELKEWIEGLRAGGGDGCVSYVPTPQLRSNVSQERLEAEEGGKTGPRAGGGLCAWDARRSRAKWSRIGTTDQRH